MTAFTANAEFASFEAVEQRLKIRCNGLNQGTRTKSMQMIEDLEAPDGVEPENESQDSRQVEAPQTPWHLLLQFKNGHRKRPN